MRFSSVILPLSLSAVAAAYPPGYITPTLAPSVASVTESAGSAIASASSVSSLAADVTEAAGYVASSASAINSVAADVTESAALAISSASSVTELASSAVSSAAVLSESASSVLSYASEVSSSAAAASSSAVAEKEIMILPGNFDGDRFICEDVPSKVSAYCCKNLMYFSDGHYILLAPQECQAAPIDDKVALTGAGLPTYVCPSNQVFGRCCPADESVKSCNSQRPIAGLDEFMTQGLDYSTYFPSYLSGSTNKPY